MALQFGRYRMIAELGQGGMAEVCLAMIEGPTGSGFTKLAVVKRLRAHLAEDHDFITMLVDEARISARLNHPNVVQTLEVGRVGEQYFLAMEYLDGQPLSRIRKRIERVGTTLSPAIEYLVVYDALAGLQHAHDYRDYDGKALGIVHRDVSPHNILVTYDGQVKVVDFGIAKAAGRAHETQHGEVKGKLRYMSPEQVFANDVDHRSDLFSIGIVLWETATRCRFWGRREDIEVLNALAAKRWNPSPRVVDPTIPEAIDRICRKALAPELADRYASANELRADLDAFFAAELVQARRVLGSVVSSLFERERRELRELIDRAGRETAATPSILQLSDSALLDSSNLVFSAPENELTLLDPPEVPNDAALVVPPPVPTSQTSETKGHERRYFRHALVFLTAMMITLVAGYGLKRATKRSTSDRAAGRTLAVVPHTIVWKSTPQRSVRHEPVGAPVATSRAVPAPTVPPPPPAPARRNATASEPTAPERVATPTPTPAPKRKKGQLDTSDPWVQ